MSTLFSLPRVTPVDSSGQPYAAAKLYFYAAGTLVHQLVYTDEALTVAHAQPVVADSNGRFAAIYLNPDASSDYRIQLKTSADVLIYDQDNIPRNESTSITTNDVFVALYPLTDAETSAGVTPVNYQYPVGNVLRYGTNTTPGSTDMHTAFTSAWNAIKETGGTVTIPQGVYTLSATWVLDVSLSGPYNYSVIGYGAELRASGTVTGHAIQVYKGYNNFGVTIEGLHFNHRANSTVGGCIQSKGSIHLRIINCSQEGHDTKAGYSGIELGPSTEGDVDTNSFWTLIDGFSTRQRTSGDGANPDIGIRLKGNANATKIVNCSLSFVDDAIVIDTDGVSGALANAVRILHNDFEIVTNCVTIKTDPPADYMPTGLQIAFNRAEIATTFLKFTGAAVSEVPVGINLYNNYLTVGSVTNYLVNPNNQYSIFSYEPAVSGVGTRNIMGGSANFTIIPENYASTPSNFVIRNLSGSSTYAGAHLVLGDPAISSCLHIWFNTGNDKLYMKRGSSPASATDGTVIATIGVDN